VLVLRGTPFWVAVAPAVGEYKNSEEENLLKRYTMKKPVK
jgi:DNA topoisomerase VI subunit B